MDANGPALYVLARSDPKPCCAYGEGYNVDSTPADPVLASCAGLFVYGFISPFLPKHDDIMDLDLDEEDDEGALLRHL